MDISDGAKDDLRWFIVMMDHAPLSCVSLERLVNVHTDKVDVVIDASDDVLCVLVPVCREHIYVRFTVDEMLLVQLATAGNSTIALCLL